MSDDFQGSTTEGHLIQDGKYLSLISFVDAKGKYIAHLNYAGTIWVSKDISWHRRLRLWIMLWFYRAIL